MIGAIAYWLLKWFVTFLAFGCLCLTIRDALRSGSGRVNFFNGTLDVAGSMFSFAFFAALAFALWVA
ncbi:MAG: hypothetical protein Q7S58_05145 [Candidatus Binatus sp.]|uniref:hypothetical protein n=1 Tax=Candidatus Binatus sp. TaxID=2811406 RepID=UPI002718A2C2|nr:hypothetical protein [Candidatus Binatus sp.]MDO8431779.1 hypothetical protein [Candidatus Binatus sp.]